MDMLQGMNWHIVQPEAWLIAALALMVVCIAAYVPPVGRVVLIPMWWRVMRPVLIKLSLKLDRLGRTNADLVFRAGVVVVALVFFSVLVGQGVLTIDRALSLNGLLPFLGLLSTLQADALWRVMRASNGLSDDGMQNGEAARALIATYDSAPFADGFAVRRLLIAHGALAFDKMVMMPITGFLLFGLSGALAFSTLAAFVFTLRLMPPHTAFSGAVFALEKLLGAVPNYTAGLFLALSTLVAPRAGIARALDAMKPSAPLVAYENGGKALAVVAWGLAHTLGGPLKSRDGTLLNWNWVGPEGASAKIEGAHIPLMLFWGMVAHLILLVALMSASLWARTI